jgi:hypothetical protein
MANPETSERLEIAQSGSKWIQSIEPMRDPWYHIGKIDTRTLETLSSFGLKIENFKLNGEWVVAFNRDDKFRATTRTDNGPIEEAKWGVAIDKGTKDLSTSILPNGSLQMISKNYDGTTDFITFEKIPQNGWLNVEWFKTNAPSYVQILNASTTEIKLRTQQPSTWLSRWIWGKWMSTEFDAALGEITIRTDKADPFTKMEWKELSLSQLWLSQSAIGQLQRARFGLNTMRSVANIESKNDKSILIPTVDGSGFATICPGGSVNIYDKDNPIPAWGVARKPVIYLYPKKKTSISVSVELKNATMVAEYPKTSKGEWEVEATPRGNLTDISTKKKYSYLFWEAEKKLGFTLDISQAHCIASDDIVSYLEKSLKTLGLNIREANDFMVYWLPVLEKNKYSLIEWKTTEYTDMAKLLISPKPDTLIRIFMVFRTSSSLIKTGNPKLSKSSRKWYSVVEWGGCNLDEGWNIR